MPTPRFVLATAALAALAGQPLITESAAARIALPQSAQPVTQQEAASEPLVTVQFNGGTTAQYIDALRSSSRGSPVNVVMSDAAAGAKLPPFSLANAPLSTAIYAIESAAGTTSGNWKIYRIAPGGTVSSSDRGSPAFAIDFVPRAGRHANDAMLEAFSVQRVLATKESGDGVSAGKLLSAIDVALGMQSEDGPRPELKFHEDSGLLFIRGTGDDIRIVSSVISRMSDDLNRTRNMMSQARYEAEQRDIAIRDAELIIHFNEEELQRSVKELEQMNQLVKEGHASTSALNEAESRVSRARIEYERAKLQLQRAKLGTYNPLASQAAGTADRKELLDQIAELQARLQRVEGELKAAQQSGGGAGPRQVR
jgi:hypothetical protein